MTTTPKPEPIMSPMPRLAVMLCAVALCVIVAIVMACALRLVIAVTFTVLDVLHRGGVGVFGLSCAPSRLTGIESGRQAVEFARRNAAAQGAAHARFFAEQVGRSLRKLRVGDLIRTLCDNILQ